MHLIVLCHGMWGSPKHMLEIERGILNEYPSSLVLNCQQLGFFATFQGVDNCGWRLSVDVLRAVAEFDAAHESDGEKISSISFIGYSLGGLICRYCIGLLQEKAFFDRVKPIHLITMATPHLGTRLRTRTASGRVLNGFINLLINLYAGRSGDHLALIDGGKKNPPLLVEMTLPESSFIKGLQRFAHVYVYANASNDNTVPYCTSSLSYKNKWKSLDSKKRVDSSNGSYAFILECARIGEDEDCEEYRDRHMLKPANEFSLWSIFLITLIFVFGLPFLMLHIMFVAIPMRTISLFYRHPAEANLCKRCELEKGAAASDPDLCPWIILKNLKESVNIHRVAVLIPGAHTHGKVVCRFTPNDGGLDVIRHLVKEVLSQQQQQSKDDDGGKSTEIDPEDIGLDEEVTKMNVNM